MVQWVNGDAAPRGDLDREFTDVASTAASGTLRIYLQDWYGWATGTQTPEDGKPYWNHIGLCGNLWLCPLLNDAENGQVMVELDGLFRAEFSDDRFPFGGENYGRRCGLETQHQDPIRLAWVERKLAEVGVVAAPKWYRDFRIEFEYGYYRAIHVDYEGVWDGESWAGCGMHTSSRTLAGLREEIDALLEEAE